MNRLVIVTAVVWSGISAGAFAEFKTAPMTSRPAQQQNTYPGNPAPAWPTTSPYPSTTPSPQPAQDAQEFLLRKQDMIQVRQTRMQSMQNAIYCIEAAQVTQQLHECLEQERRQMEALRGR